MVHCSEDELTAAKIKASSIEKLCKVVLLTKGKKGSAVLTEGKKTEIPAFPTKETDATGAGDTYTTAFVCKFLKTNDIKESALFASAAASLAVEGVGIASLPTEKQVRERMNNI